MNCWPTKPLGEVCSINPKLAGSDGPRLDAEVTFVPMAAIDEVSGTIARPERRRYSEVAKGYTPFVVNDVLFAKITPCMQNGKAAVASDLCGGFGFGSTEFHVLRSTGSVLPRWVFAFIRQGIFRSAAEASFTGSAGQQRVPADFLKTFPIPVPPLADQARIVNLLDKADELRKLRAQADRRTAALIPSLFHEMFGDPLGGEHKWPEVKFEEVTRRITYGFTCPMKHLGSGIPIITAKNVLDGQIDFQNVHYAASGEFAALTAKSKPERNDLLITKDGTIGRCAVVDVDFPLCINQSVALIQPNLDKVIPVFLSHYILFPSVNAFLNGMGKGQALKHLQITELAKMPIPSPSMALQKEFATRVGEIRAVQAEQTASRRRLENLFQSMLHRAFQGEL